MGYGFAGGISPKAAKKANAKLAVLRQTRAQAGKMAGFDRKEKDEGKTKGEIPHREIDHPTNQGGSARHGRQVSGAGRGKGTALYSNHAGTTSTGGGIGKAESAVKVAVDPTPANRKTWPKGGGVSASNPKTGNTRMKGPIAKTGGPYGGGGRDTQ